MKETYNGVAVPAGGKTIEYVSGEMRVPDSPVIPFIEGDGTGRDIWKASQRVFDAAVQKAYGGARRVAWLEIFAGEKAFNQFQEWLPQDSVDAIRDFRVAIKGPLTTPVGGGIRSLNVTLRQVLDLYACVRPVRYFRGVPSPVKEPERMDVVIFRENTEDVYAGIEWKSGTPEVKTLIEFLNVEMLKSGAKQVRTDSGVGIKPISPTGTKRLVRRAIQHAIENRKRVVTLVHKGNIMKYTEGAFRDWSYELAKREFGAKEIDGGPWCKTPEGIIIKDAIADITLQQVLTRPEDFDVIATLNLNGDYLSDALAAQVGGIGIAPGGNINYESGHAIFEATHGTAPKYANQDRVNPGSVVLSGEMMFRYLGWIEVADLILNGLNGAIASKRVTYDFARQMEGATEIKCSQFGDNIIEHM